MTNRTPDLRDYTFTDLVIWEPRYPYGGDSAPVSAVTSFIFGPFQ